jgi:hypothetical protein
MWVIWLFKESVTYGCIFLSMLEGKKMVIQYSFMFNFYVYLLLWSANDKKVMIPIEAIYICKIQT